MFNYKACTILLVSASSALVAQNCPGLSDAKRSALVDYVRKEYKVDENVELAVVREEAENASCYRKLTFQGASPLKTWELTMHLSPDQRFLSAELFDTTIDPAEAERGRTEAVLAGLLENKGASNGSDDAPVTIVEFSDFECPFCARFAAIFGQLSPADRDGVRLVFHHFPLSTHPWARIAAEGAACAQLQSSDEFWTIHDQLFQHQREITKDNIKEKLLEYAQKANTVDMKSFQGCINNELSLGLVFRDVNVAAANNIQATPTLFINGHRIPGVRDSNELRQLIAEAKKEGIQLHGTNTIPHR
jgi:protein-disulfide isomerase